MFSFDAREDFLGDLEEPRFFLWSCPLWWPRATSEILIWDSKDSWYRSFFFGRLLFLGLEDESWTSEEGSVLGIVKPFQSPFDCCHGKVAVLESLSLRLVGLVAGSILLIFLLGDIWLIGAVLVLLLKWVIMCIFKARRSLNFFEQFGQFAYWLASLEWCTMVREALLKDSGYSSFFFGWLLFLEDGPWTSEECFFLGSDFLTFVGKISAHKSNSSSDDGLFVIPIFLRSLLSFIKRIGDVSEAKDLEWLTWKCKSEDKENCTM